MLADEVRGTEDLADGANKWTPDQRVTGVASGHMIWISDVHDVAAKSASVTANDAISIGFGRRW